MLKYLTLPHNLITCLHCFVANNQKAFLKIVCELYQNSSSGQYISPFFNAKLPKSKDKFTKFKDNASWVMYFENLKFNIQMPPISLEGLFRGSSGSLAQGGWTVPSSARDKLYTRASH